MGVLQLHSAHSLAFTSIPNVFIDHYMAQANPSYVMVYIYALRHCDKEQNAAAIAGQLRLLESDVVNAFTYWQEQGLVAIENDSVSFLPITAPSALPPSALTEGAKPARPALPLRPVALERRPQYSTQELEIYKAQSAEVSGLFLFAEQALGRMLNANDLNMLFGLYDWLRLPRPVIEQLLTYCADNDHRSMRYIETVALDWADRGIRSVEEAQEYIQRFNRDYREILKALGVTGRNPTPKETAFMEKWLNEWRLPLPLVLEACDRTILQTGKGRFAYADTILADWRGKGIATPEEARTQSEAYRQAQAAAAPEPDKTAKGQKKSRFVNFKQRTRDYDSLEKLEREYLENELKK